MTIEAQYLSLLLHLQFNWVPNELRVLLDDVLQFLLFQVLGHVLSEVEDDLSSSGYFLGILILFN